MPSTPDFYSVNEAKKTEKHRVYHNNSACVPGRDIPKHERRPGKGPVGEPYRLCKDCKQRNDDGE